jgi:hypothetical protein
VVVWNVLLLLLWVLAKFWLLLTTEYALFKSGEPSNFSLIVSLMLVLFLIALLVVWYYYFEFTNAPVLPGGVK